MKALLLALALLAPVEGLDWTVQREVQAARRPALETLMTQASKIGKPANTMGVLLAIAIFGGPAGVVTARLAVLTAIPVNLVVETLKRATYRARPNGEHKRSNASFPSSHAANAFALAAVFARRWRRLAPAFLAAAALIAYSRLYLDRHFLSDVVVGAAIGVLAAWAVARFVARRDSSITGTGTGTPNTLP